MLNFLRINDFSIIKMTMIKRNYELNFEAIISIITNKILIKFKLNLNPVK